VCCLAEKIIWYNETSHAYDHTTTGTVDVSVRKVRLSICTTISYNLPKPTTTLAATNKAKFGATAESMEARLIKTHEAI